MSDGAARIDLGEAFTYVFKDKAWLSRLMLPGLLGFIPILGPIALLGWQRNIVERLRAEEPGLPELQLPEDLKRGLAPAAAVLNVGGLMLIGVLVGLIGTLLVAIGDATGNRTASDLLDAVALVFGLLGFGLTAGLGLTTSLLLPELLRRGHAGEYLPAMTPKVSLAALKAHKKLIFVAGVGCFIAGNLGAMGVVFCLVGMAITLPWAVATTGHLVVQWSRAVEFKPPPKAVEGPPPNAIAWTGQRWESP